MKAREALRALSEVTESQWGLVTSAQARSLGVSHMNLTRLAESSDLVRLSHGVYRDAGAPADEHEELRANWLMIDPAKLAFERLRENPVTAVVSGESAAKLHRMGDLRAARSEFTTPTRKQTQRTDVRYRTGKLPGQDVMIVAGLPVTTRERTIADLVEQRHDLSIIGDVLRDAALQSSLDTEELILLLNPLAKRNGHKEGDGAALLQQLMGIAGIDQDSVASAIASIPGLSTSIVEQYLSNLPTFDITPILNKVVQPLELPSLDTQLTAQMNNLVAEAVANIQAQAVGSAQSATKRISDQVKALGLLLAAQALQTGEHSDGRK